MEDPWSTIVIIPALLLLSGFLSFFEHVLTTRRRPVPQKKGGLFFTPVQKALENPRAPILTCRFFKNMLRILCAVLAGFHLIEIHVPLHRNIMIVAAALVLGIASFLLGELIPKLLARIAPEKKGITEDELRLALMEGEKSGIVESHERTMVEGVFYLGDRPIGAFMTHRSEIQWLDINAPAEENYAKALEYRSQRCFPVINGSPDVIVGAAYLEDIILDHGEPNPRGLQAVMKKVQFVPETMPAVKAFESFKNSEVNFLFVMDEYGGLAGIVSAKALVEEIVGNLSGSRQEEEPLIRQEDGVWYADGLLNIDEAAEVLSLPIHDAEHSSYHTLAGFVLFLAGELPRPGDSFVYQGYRFLVKQMDGNRIDKLEISKI